MISKPLPQPPTSTASEVQASLHGEALGACDAGALHHGFLSCRHLGDPGSTSIILHKTLVTRNVGFVSSAKPPEHVAAAAGNRGPGPWRRINLSLEPKASGKASCLLELLKVDLELLSYLVPQVLKHRPKAAGLVLTSRVVEG